MSRPSVLWVSAEVPHHTGWGGPIRQAHLLDALSRVADVHLVVAGEVVDTAVRDACQSVREVADVPPPTTESATVRRLRTVLPGAPGAIRRSAARTRAVRAALPDPDDHDVVILQHAELAPLLPSSRTSSRRARWVLELHYLPSVWHDHAAASSGPRQRGFHLLEATACRRAERRWARRADAVVVCSREDAAVLGTGHVVGNGVDLDRGRPGPPPDGPRAVFVGHLGYEPNVDAVAWLADEIVPRARRIRPDLEVAIVGRAPRPEVRASVERGGLELHADVPDVLPHLADARVALVPLRIGSGTRVKALEAMGTGRPVVGTTVGLEGLGVVPGRHAVVADDPEAFADGMVDVLEDDDRARRLAAAGRDLAETFGWAAMGQQYVDAVLG